VGFVEGEGFCDALSMWWVDGLGKSGEVMAAATRLLKQSTVEACPGTGGL